MNTNKVQVLSGKGLASRAAIAAFLAAALAPGMVIATKPAESRPGFNVRLDPPPPKRTSAEIERDEWNKAIERKKEKA